jgi:membrane protease YdiL (CAAX protease family)
MSEPQEYGDGAAELPSVLPVDLPGEGAGNAEPSDVETVEPAAVFRPNPLISWLKGGHPLIAWLVIAFVVVAVPFLRELAKDEAHRNSDQTGNIGFLFLNVQGKLFLGLHELTKSDPNSANSIVAQTEALDTGPLENRLARVILVGELAGFQEARAKLEELDQRLARSNLPMDPRALEAKSTLEDLYSAYATGKMGAPGVDQDRRRELTETLGWFGKLALAPPGTPNTEAREEILSSARTGCLLVLLLVVLVVIAGVAGLCCLLLFSLLYANGKIHPGLVTRGGPGGIYAETFALWMIIFIVFTGLVGQFGSAQWQLLESGAAILGTLIVLVWPVLRGISWRQVREDIGLVGGRQPLLEPLLGPVGYAMSLPVLAVGVLAMLVLVGLQSRHFMGMLGTVQGPDDFSPAVYPSHPIIPILASAGFWGKLQVFFLACFVAPVVEETMFRGVLYRHLRQATRQWPFLSSFFVSALIVSFVFAVIHPQGFLLVPPLMALAFGFTIMRQWRNSLVSCMVAHGINNALVLTLASVLFAS